MRTAILASSDWHCGSSLGLCTTSQVPLPEGGFIGASDLQRWLYKGFLGTARAARQSADRDDAKHRVLLLNGDLVDGGMHHGTVELMHPHPMVERTIAKMVLGDLLAIWEPSFVFFIHGTPAHTGKGGFRETFLAEWAEEQEWPVVRAHSGDSVWGILTATLGGVLHDVRHHGRSSRLPWTKEAYAKRLSAEIYLNQAMHQSGRPPDVAWRAHMHQFFDTGPVPPHRKGTRLIMTPSWQALGEYGRNRSIEEPTIFGHVYMMCEDGRVATVEPFLHIPDPPRVWKEPK